jgi:hypothetical protein
VIKGSVVDNPLRRSHASSRRIDFESAKTSSTLDDKKIARFIERDTTRACEAVRDHAGFPSGCGIEWVKRIWRSGTNRGVG